jgi:hypothetical protein
MKYTPARRAGSQEGSAYIIALLVLVVLTMLGLGLTMITQTEVQIGANELSTHRAFYGGEGGFNLATAKMLMENSTVEEASLLGVDRVDFVVPETRMTINKSTGNPEVFDPGTSQTRFAEYVEISPFVPLRAHCCNECNCIEGDIKFMNTNHAVVTHSRRISWLGATEPTDPQLETSLALPSTEKQLYAMVALVPWWPPNWYSLADPEAVHEVSQEQFDAADARATPAPTPLTP